MTAHPENDPPAPYVGLRPFEFHEAALFYGRGEHIAEMVRTLRKGHFLAVVGSSGSGKSSLVRAGLLPAIAAGFMDGGEEAADWRFVIMRPGLDPYENLLRELLPQVAPGQSLDSATIEFRRQTLRGGPRGLIEAVADSLLPEPARLVVLVDQFEEIFRFLERGGPSTPDDGSSLADRRNATLAFVDMLLATTAEGDPRVYVVLTMRSEYLGECEAFLGLSAAIAKSQFLTPRMTREQIQDIIERPIQAVGGRIEPQVVTDLLERAGHGSGPVAAGRAHLAADVEPGSRNPKRPARLPHAGRLPSGRWLRVRAEPARGPALRRAGTWPRAGRAVGKAARRRATLPLPGCPLVHRERSSVVSAAWAKWRRLPESRSRSWPKWWNTSGNPAATSWSPLPRHRSPAKRRSISVTRRSCASGTDLGNGSTKRRSRPPTTVAWRPTRVVGRRRKKAFFNLRNWTSPSNTIRSGLLNGRTDTEPISTSPSNI